MNKAMIIGNVGRDPEVRNLPSGDTVVNFAVATNKRVKGKDGEKKDFTEWHNVTAFGKTADVIAKYVTKGTKIYVEGELRTRKWQDQAGTDKYTTEIHVRDFEFVGSKPEGGAPKASGSSNDMFDDDIPF